MWLRKEQAFALSNVVRSRLIVETREASKSILLVTVKSTVVHGAVCGSFVRADILLMRLVEDGSISYGLKSHIVSN